MSSSPPESVPEALRSLRTSPLFVMRLKVRPILDVAAHRRIGLVSRGSFQGERLSGEVLDGGSDWLSIGKDGMTGLDVRLVLKTTDAALIAMTYRGVRHGPSDVLQRISAGQTVDPASYYFRIGAMFETAAPEYDWINRILSVGIGHRPPEGPVYSMFEVL